MDASPTTFDPKLLSEHSEWVRSLARSLVRDPGAADDVAQETWVAALRQPPDADRPARPWLGAIARNTARQLVRARDRRTRRERHAARAEALPSDQELAERAALQQWVAETVMTLDEPYRRTILLRFFEGLPPREIAARMGVPAETVKSRLRRALAQLRERLGSRDGPGGASGVVALLPLVSTTPWSAANGAGFALMGKKGLLAIAMLLTLLASAVLYAVLREPNVAPVVVGLAERIDDESAEGESLSTPTEIDDVASRATGGADERTAMPTTGGVRLVTVRHDSGLPIADVQVWFAPYAEVMQPPWDGRGQSVDVETTIHAVGTSIATDSQGSALVTKLERHSIAVARQGDLYGQVTFVPEEGSTVEIPLMIDRSITIQTITSDGQPVAGIPVGLSEFEPGRHGTVFWWAATAGEAGQVTVHHIDHALSRSIKSGSTWLLTLATPSPDPPSQHVDPRALADGPLQLVVEHGGRVVVRVENDQGRPTSKNEVVYAREVADHLDAVGRHVRPRRHSASTDNGVAVFENVAPGIELRVWTSPTDRRPTELTFPGPIAPGDEVVVRLQPGEEFPTLSGLLVDASGALLAGRPMESRGFVRAGDDAEYEVTQRFRTDAQGRFVATLRTNTAGDIIDQVLVTTDDQYEGEALTARVLLDPPLTSGESDVGRLVLEPATVVLSGRVVDANGAPINWAGIWVKRMPEMSDPGAPPYEWVHAWQTNTLKDGKFRLTQDQGPGDYRLIVKKDGYLLPDEIPFQPGMQGLEIVLRKAGGLEGKVTLRAEIPPGWLRVTVQEEAGHTPFAQGAVRPNPDGSFFLLDLAPGEIDVTVFLPAWRAPLARIANVRVESDGTRTDRRLAKLDLRDVVRLIRLDLRDEGGDAIPIGCVSFTHPDDSQTHTAFTDGLASLLSPTPTIDAEIVAPGFRPQIISGAHDGLQVVLERGIPVRVKLPEGFDIPEAPVTLSVALNPTDRRNLARDAFVYADDGTMSQRWSREQYGVSAQVVGGDELILHVGSPGTWQVDWSVGGERWSGGVRCAEGTPGTIDVDESSGSHVFELTPDADAIERMIAEYN